MKGECKPRLRTLSIKKKKKKKGTRRKICPGLYVGYTEINANFDPKENKRKSRTFSFSINE